MTRASRLRDAGHGLLAATLLYLRWHLARLPLTAVEAGSSDTLAHLQEAAAPSSSSPPPLTPLAVARWDVLAQTTLLALVLFRVGALLVGSGPEAALFDGRHDEVGVRDLERFVGAAAGGVWGTRHFILLLQLSAGRPGGTSVHELAVLRATGLASVTFVVLTALHIAWINDGDGQAPTASVPPVAPSDNKKHDPAPRPWIEWPPLAEEVLPNASPVLRSVTLTACGATTVLIGAIAIHDRCRAAAVLLLPVIFTVTFVLSSRWLTAPQLNFCLVAGILLWFFSATWYSTVTPHGPAGRPPWQSLLWLSNIVGLSIFSWVAGLNISLGVTAQPIFGPASVQRVLNLLPRVFDAAFDRLLRSTPVTDVYDGPTGTSPAGQSALL